MKTQNLTALETERKELWAKYDKANNAARNTSSIRKMNVYMSMATDAYSRISEINNLLNA